MARASIWAGGSERWRAAGSSCRLCPGPRGSSRTRGGARRRSRSRQGARPCRGSRSVWPAVAGHHQAGRRAHQAAGRHVHAALGGDLLHQRPLPPCLGLPELNKWHTTMGASLETSHLQILVSPVTIVYEEGTSVGTNLVSQYAAMTFVILGKASLVECLFDNSLLECLFDKPQFINLLKFHHSEGGAAKKTPDMKLVYKDCFDPGETSPVSSVSLSFNSCCIDLDLGFTLTG